MIFSTASLLVIAPSNPTVRLSIGIEHPSDLFAVVEQELNAA